MMFKGGTFSLQNLSEEKLKISNQVRYQGMFSYLSDMWGRCHDAWTIQIEDLDNWFTPGNSLWPFWDGYKVVGDLQQGDKKVTTWITWLMWIWCDFKVASENLSFLGLNFPARTIGWVFVYPSVMYSLSCHFLKNKSNHLSSFICFQCI